MKRIVFLFVSLLMVISVSTVSAGTAELMKEADSLFVYENGTLDNYMKSADIYKKILETEPDNYEAAWKCARSLRYYANLAQQQDVDGWKDICKTYGKEGMNLAQKAIDLKPDQPDGYYYFGLNVGVYSDGVSIVTALKEGLKDKTQNSFEKVLELNPTYEKGGAMVGLGRFWSVLPWPLKKKKIALQYFRQYQTTEFFGTQPEGVIYMTELLIDMGGKENKAEAKEILAKFETDNPFFKKEKEKLQGKL